MKGSKCSWRPPGYGGRSATIRPVKANSLAFCVTGPDEYNTVVDNNVYTNLMARKSSLWPRTVNAVENAQTI